MSINKQNVSNRLFDILVGSGNAILMGDDEAKKTLDPNLATRFYLKDKHSMIHYDRSAGNIALYVGNNQQYDDVKDLINAVKTTARHYMLNFTVKNYGKKLEPKDFAFQITKESVSESVSMTGTTKSSYQKLENARLIIRHTKSVNEEIKGARSRSIQAIFVENKAGERFSYPYKYLAGARALAHHVSEGGNPYDEQGQKLIKLAEQYISLKKFVAHSKRSNFVNEDTARLVELAEQKALEIGRAFKTGRGLAEMTLLTTVEDTSRVAEMQNNFTKKSVNTAVESAMPYVLALLDQATLQESATNEIADIIGQLDTIREIELSKMDDSDVDHPSNLNFGSDTDSRNKHVARFLAKHAVDTDVANKLQSVISVYDTLDSDTIDQVSELLRNLIRKSVVINKEHVVNAGVSDIVLSSVQEAISKYTASAILSK
jgi:hypothetical protein